MFALCAAVFALTYAGMAFGRVPGLRVDRSGIAALGAIAMVALSAITPDEALRALDFPTLLVLFGLMIVSAQLGESGFYGVCAARITALGDHPHRLLVAVVLVSGVLSALLTNDVVVFALAPLLCRGLTARKLDPRPFLVALAGGANAGSAATSIGNPQNVAIAQMGNLDFVPFFLHCVVPAALGLACVVGVVLYGYRDVLSRPSQSAAPIATTLDRPQAMKGLAALLAIVALFVSPMPDVFGVVFVAGLLLVSRRVSSRAMLERIDWPLLVLFAGLFIVTAAFAGTGFPGRILRELAARDLQLDRARLLAPLSLVGSNTIGNVPLVAMLLTIWRSAPPGALYALAALSTLAGNLTIAGSLANIIVVERAAKEGVTLGFREHARCGVPMTLLSMAVATAWFIALGSISI